MSQSADETPRPRKKPPANGYGGHLRPGHARDPEKLTPLEEAMCAEYLVDLDMTAAYRRAGGRSTTEARKAAWTMFQRERVQTRVRELMAARAERTQITVDAVLERLWQIATADPNEIVGFRRTCCRHCWGVNHQYQMTQAELDAREAEWAKAKGRKPTDVFDPLGGAGFHAHRDPNPECPECFGDGMGQVHIADTRKLSPAARALYAGVKQTKEGLEAKLNDQMAALVKVGDHLGMFRPQPEAPVTEEERIRRLRAAILAMDEATSP